MVVFDVGNSIVEKIYPVEINLQSLMDLTPLFLYLQSIVDLTP